MIKDQALVYPLHCKIRTLPKPRQSSSIAPNDYAARFSLGVIVSIVIDH